MSILIFSPCTEIPREIPRPSRPPPTPLQCRKDSKMVQTQIPGYQPEHQDQVVARNKEKSYRGIVMVF
jgi:hypothetical protein